MVEIIKKDGGKTPEAKYPKDSICPLLGIIVSMHALSNQPMMTAVGCLGASCKPFWDEEAGDCALKKLWKKSPKK